MPELQTIPQTYTSEILIWIALLTLTIYGITLLIKSKRTPSISLKIGILTPMIIITSGLLWKLGDLINIIDFGSYVLIFVIAGLPISFISIISSIISLVKLENKSLAIATLIYGILFFLLWLIPSLISGFTIQH
jgi:hypothetical protein